MLTPLYKHTYGIKSLVPKSVGPFVPLLTWMIYISYSESISLGKQ